MLQMIVETLPPGHLPNHGRSLGEANNLWQSNGIPSSYKIKVQNKYDILNQHIG